MMMKALQYEFMPSKEEEEACAASKKPYKPSRTLVEIQPFYPLPAPDPNSPWAIRKRLSPTEVRLGRLAMSHRDAFDHVFRWWDLQRAKDVVIKGKRSNVTVRDITDAVSPLTYCGQGLFVEKGPGLDDEEEEWYVLSGCQELISSRGCNVGDEVGLYWDVATEVFHFKLLRRREKLELDLDLDLGLDSTSGSNSISSM